jgi:flagellar biosynthesis chaperone FliJ
MLKHYLSLQQDALEQQGKALNQQQNMVKLEQQRQSQLEEYRDTLATTPDLVNVLVRQNNLAMQDYLGHMIHAQATKVQQVEAELRTCRNEFRQSYARVKGLERLQTQQEQQRVTRDERRLRNTLDDLSCFQFSQRHKS